MEKGQLVHRATKEGQDVLVLAFLRRYVQQDAPVYPCALHRRAQVGDRRLGRIWYAALLVEFQHRGMRKLIWEHVSMKIYNHAKNYTTFSRQRRSRAGIFYAAVVI